MSDIATRLLFELKDFSSCNDDLAVKIRKTVLEPFQLDLSRPESIKKPPPTPTRFKQMAKQLAPIAMRIVNQNLQELSGLKRTTSISGNYTVVVNCLLDTSIYALAALRHMNLYSTLKPLDIEKTTSNLICKMVILGEYNRALDELRKFRSVLASYAKVSLDSKSTTVANLGIKQQTVKNERLSASKGYLTESINNARLSRSSSPVVPDFIVSSQWEDDMLTKYGDLFQFPLDTSINDASMILLILACQINALRCWCGLGDGSLAKFVPYLMDKSGSFFDWCKQLYNIDSTQAKKQLDSLQLLLYKVANKYPATEETAFHRYNLQAIALKAISFSKSEPLKLVMNRMVQIGAAYTTATPQASYNHIQKCCGDFIENINPNVSDLAEMESYFYLCEYYAFVSQKAKSYKGAFYAYKHMIRPIREIVGKPDCIYFYATYAANAKLSLGAVQMDKMVLDDTYADISMTLQETVSCLKAVSNSLEKNLVQGTHSDQALYKLCKAIDLFKQSAKRLYEFVTEKKRQQWTTRLNEPGRTPPRKSELVASGDFGKWNSIISELNTVLLQCSEILPTSLCLIRSKASTPKSSTSQIDIMNSFVDIMVLVARMQFQVGDENTYNQAYDYLSAAEQLCAEKKFTSGYRWLASAYYNLSASMIKSELFSPAIYSLRKSCVLLEKDIDRINTDEGRLQLCKRYEILGTCCQKNEHFDDAIKNYRLALKRVPLSAIQQFVCKANTVAVSTVIESEPLVPKLLDRFLRASVIDPHQKNIDFASINMDLSKLNAIQQSIIYECELKVWSILAMKMNLVKYQLAIVDKLLQIYDGETYPIRRARVLLSRVRIERYRSANKEACTWAALTYATEALNLMKTQDYAEDSNLLNYRRHYYALASSWTLLCKRELGEETSETFYSPLQQWGILLKKLPPIFSSDQDCKDNAQRVYEKIDDINQFYDHVRMLADLFGVTGQHVYQINALRILLKLNNGLREISADRISDSITITCAIGKIYCDLGYTGKASKEFALAKKVISEQPCSNHAELLYRVNYAKYLSIIGDYENSKQVFDATKFTWQHSPPLESKNGLATTKAYTLRSMLLANAYYTKTLLLANTEALDNAIASATSAVRLLNKCIKLIQQRDDERKEYETEGAPSMKSRNPFTTTSSEAAQIVFRESQWSMAQQLVECFHTLVQLYLKKGTWNEAKYFSKQIPLLATSIGSDSMMYDSYLRESDFALRIGDFEKCQDNLEQALLRLPKDDKTSINLGQNLVLNHIKDSVRLKIATANLAAARGYYSEAIDTYDEANNVLQQLCNVEYVESLEQLACIRENDKDAKEGLLNDPIEVDDRYECLPLQQMQSFNIVQKSIALSSDGKNGEGLALLDHLEEADMALYSEVEVNTAIASLKLASIRDEISKKSINSSEVMLLPTLKAQVARGAANKKNNMNQELRLIRDNLTNTLERMTESHLAGYVKERTIIIEDLCKKSSFSLFLKSQLSNNTKILGNNSSLLCSYYMELAKGICLRREMQNCLKSKMYMLHTTPSDSAWPLSEEEQIAEGRPRSNPEWLQSHLSTLSVHYQQENEMESDEFQQKFVNILPTNWTVCSLTVDLENNDLYAIQLRANEVPFVVKIPLHRANKRARKHTSIEFKDAVTEFQDIIRNSDDTIHNSKNYTNPDDVEKWWTTRKDLDSRLKTLLENIESNWFSGFKGILSGHCQEYKEELFKFQKSLSEVVYKTVNEATLTKIHLDMNVAFCRMVLCIGRHPNARDLEDIAYFTLSCYESNEVKIDYEKIDFKKMTDMIRILITKYHENSNRAGVDTLQIIPNDHVILILDKHMQTFPLENMPILRSRSVSRLPCLSLLRDRILYNQAYQSREAFNDFGAITPDKWTDVTVSRKSLSYVLNPGGDLLDTQKEFEPILKRNKDWQGVIKEMPQAFASRDYLESFDIYMYFGHSGGQTFMKGTAVRQLPTCAVSLLMGCSSGTLETFGEFDPHGYVLNFLLAGSPAVVANLWDVTDRSIDKLSKHMIQTWGLLSKSSNSATKSKSLVQAVAESRNHCKLPYLIGAAPVVYGIPVYINPSS